MAFKFSSLLKGRVAWKSAKRLSPESTEILRQARVLHQQGQATAAAAGYRAFLDLHPDHRESLNAIAAIALQTGDLEGATRAYSIVIAHDRNDAEAYYKRGNARNSLGQWEAALADYDKAVKLDRNFATAFCNRGTVLERLGRPDEALRSYDRALSLSPEDSLSHYNRGSALKAMRRFDDALSSYERATALNEHYVEAHLNRANVLRELSRYEESLASYDKAGALAPGSPLARLSLVGRGLALVELTRYEEAVASYDNAIGLDPADFLVHTSRGLALKKLKRPADALASFEQAIALQSNYPEAHFYRGQVLDELQQFEAAVASYDRAIEFTPAALSPYVAYLSRGSALAALRRFDEALTSFGQAISLEKDYVEAYCSRGQLLQELRRYEEAIENYDEAIAIAPSGAQAYSAYCNRALTLKDMKRLNEALEDFDRAIELKDDDAEMYMNRGGVMQELGYHEAAITSFDRAAALRPDLVEAFQGRGFSLLNRGRHQDAIASFDQAIALKPSQKFLQGFRRYVQMQICDWHDLGPYLERLGRELMDRNPVSAPFPVLALVDSPHLHRLAAEIWVAEECPPDGMLGAIPMRPLGDKLRVAYFSADFRHHPVSLLTAELFELHDRSQFEVIGFAFGPRVNDGVRARLEKAFDRFIDASELSDVDVARTARELAVDIAVDLGGFTEFARPKVFSLRAAPVQMSYIGYLGTMAGPYVDYLLADATIIPAQERQFYSEQIIYLPSYQVNDSKRRTIDRSLTREELGLPATGFVFSCFNSNYKIMPATFAAWMRILLRVEESCLYLYAGNALAERNLRDATRRHGVNPSRIVFGSYLAQEDYLARFRTMDLFLDTLPYNAGTTASDALWAGLPVLTCTGRAFAGRVAASLLNAIGLPELVTSTIEEYEEKAVQLASNRDLLLELRRQLDRNRLTTALFDTRSFTRHLETAYRQAQERYRSGLSPETIVVTAQP